MPDINIGAITEALNDKEDRDLRNTDTGSGADAVIEFQRPTAENNYTWYRKYASGWVEQGGLLIPSGAGPVNVVLLKEMVDINYMFIGSAVYSNNAATDHQESTNELSAKTTTGFTKYLWGKWTRYWWKVEGMSAS